MVRKLSPGIHNVRVKGQGMRRVRVLANGQWRFMKGSAKTARKSPKRSKPKKAKKARKREAKLKARESDAAGRVNPENDPPPPPKDA